MSFTFFRPNRSIRIYLIITAAGVLLAFAASPCHIRAGEPRTADFHYYQPAESAGGDRSLAASRIKFVLLYTVNQGKIEKMVLKPGDLQSRRFEVKGYVSGVVAFCEEEMAVHVEGRPMSPIKVDADGAVWLKNFGKISAAEFSPLAEAMGYQLGSSIIGAAGQPSSILPGGYAFFPEVLGDAVSPGTKFDISFEADGEKRNFTVQQSAYTAICAVVPDLARGRDPIPFCYAGNPSGAFMGMPAAVNERIQAVAKGIGSVESVFSANLVDNVTIIDAENRHNAITSTGQRRIWFYTNAFLGEPLEELSVIAEHESLHILVDLLQLTERLEVRELFADLKGYDPLSRERFELVTAGRVPPRLAGNQSGDALFFAFISENHFLKGMKGGHAQADIEEFCTSFLHSLMYIERFGDAMAEPIKLRHSSPRHIAPNERRELAKNYYRTLDVFAKALSSSSSHADSRGSEPAAAISIRIAQARVDLQGRI